MPRFSRVTVAAIAVASVLAFILLLVFIGLFLYNRKRRRQRSREDPLMRHRSFRNSPIASMRPVDNMIYSPGVSIDPFSEEAIVGDGITVESDSDHGDGQKSPLALSPVSPTREDGRRRRSFLAVGTGGLLRSPATTASAISPISIPRRVLPPVSTPFHRTCE
jgi:hypothetical protein